MMKSKHYKIGIAALLLVAGAAASAHAFAASPNVTGQPGTPGFGMHMRGGHAPGVFGTVTSVSGNTITITSSHFMRPTSSTSTPPAQTSVTYTVDATNATVTKSGAASSVSAITVGDTIMVQGTVSGTSVTATKINDGARPRPMGGNGGAVPASFTGNGSPIVGGTVTAISGDTITFTNKSNASYTADATSATITKSGVTTPTVSNISVGDSILVQGTVNGTSITASTIIDQGLAPSANQGSTTSASQPHQGIFGSLGNFFSKMFGF